MLMSIKHAFPQISLIKQRKTQYDISINFKDIFKLLIVMFIQL